MIPTELLTDSTDNDKGGKIGFFEKKGTPFLFKKKSKNQKNKNLLKCENERTNQEDVERLAILSHARM